MKKNNIEPAKKDYFKLMHIERSMINKNLFISIILIFSGLFFISHYFLKDKSGFQIRSNGNKRQAL